MPFLAPASAPTSPVTTRSKYDRQSGSLPPVTPQRLSTRSQRINLRSPMTPASNLSTPYTPLSLRSFSSSNGSSLATPASAISNRTHNVNSPEISFIQRVKDHGLADIAENWRNRATENGIKVSSCEESYQADDEESTQTPSVSTSSPPAQENDASLPFREVPVHRRARAQSYAIPPRSSLLTPRTPLSPQVLRTPARVLNTPPQKLHNTHQLKLKGSLTDPAQTRRRPSFGQNTTDLFNIDENEYTPYPQSFTSPARPMGLPVSLSDPFHPTFPALYTISEDDFHSRPQPQSNIAISSTKTNTSSCSVCGRASSSLAILEPCNHPLCSACLTSALNIVGEKDMECAVCRTSVQDFHLKAITENGNSTLGAPTNPPGNPFAPVSMPASTPNARGHGLGSAFEPNTSFSSISGLVDDFKFFDLARDSSTPVTANSPIAKPGEDVVLRIDNVPWDITPPTIAAWLHQPIVRAHVLLDRKGKTLSHAFVEFASEELARAALRDTQNSVLGRGKRARGVTVTRSSQEELMRALFPRWIGGFDGSHPSLKGMDSAAVVKALERGLLEEGELEALLHLIRAPDSHFLKVPSLPFHSLISILSKFPADIDSRVFWSISLRDLLHDVTSAAIQVLLSRVHGKTDVGLDDPDLLSRLIFTGVNCQAFTDMQVNQLSSLLSPLLPTSPQQAGSYHATGLGSAGSPYGQLAQEFGVDAELVQALARRLSGMC